MARTAEGIEHFDFQNLSDEQLREVLARVKAIIDERVRNRIDEYRQMAREAGYELSLTKIGEGSRYRQSRSQVSGGDQRSVVAPRYRNPDNPAETWSGRGHRPQWMKAQLDAGKKLEELLIPTSG